MDLMAQFPDKYFDLAIVDPPYFNGPNTLGYYGASTSSIGVSRKGYKKIGSWEIPSEEYFKELVRVSKHQIIWGCNYYVNHIESVGRIVWDKVNGDSSFSDAEIASCSVHDSVRMFSYMWNGMQQGLDSVNGKIMLGDKSKNEARIHPTQKPVHLYKWLLRKYAKNGFKIIDTHLGSASIALAVHEMNMIDKMCIQLTACEIDPDYFNSSLKRVEQATKQLSLI